MNQRQTLIIAALLLVVSLACGTSTAATPAPQSVSPTSTPRPLPTETVPPPVRETPVSQATEVLSSRIEADIAQPAAATPRPVPALQSAAPDLDSSAATVGMMNYSGAEICHVYISPATSDSWGEDRLGDQETILDGAERDFALPPDTYDLLVEDCDEQTLYEERAIVLQGTYPVLVGGGRGGAPEEAALTIFNTLDAEICYLLVAPSAGESWGGDRLGGEETLPPGLSITLRLSPGEYSVAGLDCNKEVLVMKHYIPVSADDVFETGSAAAEVPAPSAEEPAATMGGGVKLRMVNATAGDICYVFIVPATAEQWGADQLGGEEIVPAGGARDFQLEAGRYHLKAEDCDRATVTELRDVEIASDATWTVGEADAAATEAPPPATTGTGATDSGIRIRFYNDAEATVTKISFEIRCIYHPDQDPSFPSDPLDYIPDPNLQAMMDDRGTLHLLPQGEAVLPGRLQTFDVPMHPACLADQPGEIMLSFDHDAGGFNNQAWIRWAADGRLTCQDVLGESACGTRQEGSEVYWYPRMNVLSLPFQRARVVNMSELALGAIEFGAELSMDSSEHLCNHRDCWARVATCEGCGNDPGPCSPKDSSWEDGYWQPGDMCVFDLSLGAAGSADLRVWRSWDVDPRNPADCDYVNWVPDIRDTGDMPYELYAGSWYDTAACGGVKR